MAANGASTDVLVVGAGPAGLAAAVYLSRFHLAVTVVDRGRGRASLIPRSRNVAGFPEGVGGEELLDRMRAHARAFGAAPVRGEVEGLERRGAGFHATGPFGGIGARAVLLATGVTNRRPPMDAKLHDEALRRGLVRYCPVCDAFEVTDRPVAVVGGGSRAVREAMFLRAYTAELTLIVPRGAERPDPEGRRQLAEAATEVVEAGESDVGFAISNDRMAVTIGARAMTFASVYPALGSDIHSGLAGQVGARRTEEGCIVTDAHQRTSVAGLYAAGDVVLGLDQISHAVGEAAVAATAIRNDLAATAPLRR